MRLSIRQPADSLPIPLHRLQTEFMGRVVPLRIGDLAYAATLVSAGEAGERGWDVEVVLDLPDSDLRWEALIQPTA